MAISDLDACSRTQEGIEPQINADEHRSEGQRLPSLGSALIRVHPRSSVAIYPRSQAELANEMPKPSSCQCSPASREARDSVHWNQPKLTRADSTASSSWSCFNSVSYTPCRIMATKR